MASKLPCRSSSHSVTAFVRCVGHPTHSRPTDKSVVTSLSTRRAGPRRNPTTSKCWESRRKKPNACKRKVWKHTIFSPTMRTKLETKIKMIARSLRTTEMNLRLWTRLTLLTKWMIKDPTMGVQVPSRRWVTQPWSIQIQMTKRDTMGVAYRQMISTIMIQGTIIRPFFPYRLWITKDRGQLSNKCRPKSALICLVLELALKDPGMLTTILKRGFGIINWSLIVCWML